MRLFESAHVTGMHTCMQHLMQVTAFMSKYTGVPPVSADVSLAQAFLQLALLLQQVGAQQRLQLSQLLLRLHLLHPQLLLLVLQTQRLPLVPLTKHLLRKLAHLSASLPAGAHLEGSNTQ